MRVLYQPNKLVYQCHNCGMTVELSSQEVLGSTLYEHCPACKAYCSFRIITDKPILQAIKSKCQSCGCGLAQGDTFCNRCGAPVGK